MYRKKKNFFFQHLERAGGYDSNYKSYSIFGEMKKGKLLPYKNRYLFNNYKTSNLDFIRSRYSNFVLDIPIRMLFFVVFVYFIVRFFQGIKE